MSNTTFNTRMKMKYDTYANWTAQNPILLEGELAITTIVSGTTQTVNSVTPPQILIKVGDGVNNYNSLPFASGLAADVYAWAKEATKPEYAASEIKGLTEFVENISDIDTNTTYSLSYDSENKKIKLIPSEGQATEIDASAFIKDGMISSVSLDGNKNLVITFNTDAGTEDISVPLNSLVDVYTGVDGSKINVSVSSDNKISADVKAGTIEKTDLTSELQTHFDAYTYINLFGVDELVINATRASITMPESPSANQIVNKGYVDNAIANISNNIADLEQTEGDYVIFDCGSSTKNI